MSVFMRWLVVLTVALGAGFCAQSTDELWRAAANGDKAALQELRTRAEQGDAFAQFNLGSMYSLGQGVSRDSAQAVAWARKAADQGVAEAQTFLGLMYDRGEGVSKDSAQAVFWYRKAAEQGLAGAQHNLGEMYSTGEGVPKDAARAAFWYRKAAEQGFAGAQYNLGVMYRTGEGVPKDAAQAVAWLRKAAEQGVADAQTLLGVMYARGEGVPTDSAQAVGWYRKAADQGNASAQFNLGMTYRDGDGVPVDFVAAYMWFNLAAAQGNEVSKKGRDIIEKQMTAQQIAEAQRLSKEQKATEQSSADPKTANKRFVPMLQEGGVYVIPIVINTAITLKFIVDSGAADVSIPADVVATLIRTGTITQADFIGVKAYTLADGSTISLRTFRIRSLKVGDIVLENVVGTVAKAEGDLLLGQSFLGRFKSWSIDNTKHALVLE